MPHERAPYRTAPATRRWKLLSRKFIPQQVGTFFEHLTRSIVFGGHVSDGNDADLHLRHVNAAVEIKGCDNTHPIRIPVDQLSRYAELANGFPYDHALYFIYRYRARSNRTAKSGLHRAKTPELRAEFLFAELRDLWVIDHRVLCAMAAKFAPRQKALPLDPERSCLIVSREFLDRLFGVAWSDTLSSLDLDPVEFAIAQHVLRLEPTGVTAGADLRLNVRMLVHVDLADRRIVRRSRRVKVHLPGITSRLVAIAPAA